MAESAEKTNQQISTIVGVVAETPEKVAEGSCLKRLFLTVCCSHATYAFQSESTLYSCLNVNALLARNRRDI